MSILKNYSTSQPLPGEKSKGDPLPLAGGELASEAALAGGLPFLGFGRLVLLVAAVAAVGVVTALVATEDAATGGDLALLPEVLS